MIQLFLGKRSQKFIDWCKKKFFNKKKIIFDAIDDEWNYGNLQTYYIDDCYPDGIVRFRRCEQVDEEVYAYELIQPFLSNHFLSLDTDFSYENSEYYNIQSINESEQSHLSAIDVGAFSYCVSLSSVNLNSVQKIGKYAFQGCSKLRYIEFDNVKEIETGTFTYCILLSSISLQQVEKINQNAFCSNISLEEFYSDSVLSIYDRAFGYSGLKKIGCPEIKYIGHKPFNDTILETINLRGRSDDSIPIIETDSFDNNGNMINVIIPTWKMYERIIQDETWMQISAENKITILVDEIKPIYTMNIGTVEGDQKYNGDMLSSDTIQFRSIISSGLNEPFQKNESISTNVTLDQPYDKITSLSVSDQNISAIGLSSFINCSELK